MYEDLANIEKLQDQEARCIKIHSKNHPAQWPFLIRHVGGSGESLGFLVAVNDGQVTCYLSRGLSYAILGLRWQTRIGKRLVSVDGTRLVLFSNF